MKTKPFIVESDGEDNGKIFILVEMSALKADIWATKALFAIARGQVVVPENMSSSGMAMLAEMGLSTLLLAPYEMAQPLLDDLMACVKIQRDPQRPDIVLPLIESDIQEAATHSVLREAVFGVIAGFFLKGKK